MYKIGQSKQTIFLNKSKGFKHYYSKEGLGFETPCVFNKAYGKRPSLYSYEVQLFIDKYPKFGIRDMLSLTDAEKESEGMKRHDPKFTTMNFCYDYPNKTYFSSPKKKFDTDFVQTYSDAEQTSDLKPKAYVPILVLEEKILELEKLLKTA